MGILFCDKCGKISKIEKIDNKRVVRCSCGFEKQLEEHHEVSSTENMPIVPEKGKGAVSGKNQLATFPHTCKKCGYDKAQVIDLGVWFSDEAGVIRYRCGKCGFTEQDKDSNT